LGQQVLPSRPSVRSAPLPADASLDAMQMGDDLEALNYDNLEAVAQLTSSERYRTIMAAVRQAEQDDAAGTTTAWAGPTEEDPTYR
jgi:U4/U6 small nuclear ribonucleoprotein PRP31